ncbi:hypothetical protein K438DRAFT_1976575 [Mycena galopus ATCC 62051]|nr:hypothetical protein K438DRAFT_1976575 [Mycena galopus ATCC 62051]
MIYRLLTKNACQPLMSFREHRPRHGLKDKDLIDYWLTCIQEDPYQHSRFFRDILTMGDIQPAEVMGQVRCVTMAVQSRGPVYHHADSHLLFIQATTPPTSGLIPAVRDSPIAILDYHYGSSFEYDAPLWTRMAHTLSFRMDRGDAAQLFADLALAPDNLLERGLSQQLVDWACYAATGTPTVNNNLRPETPRKAVATRIPRRPVKRKQVYGDEDRAACLRRRLF